jgi:hypothetical protein
MFMGWFNKKELAEIERLKMEINTLKNTVNLQSEKIPQKLYNIRDKNIYAFYHIQKDFFSPRELMLFEKLSAIITSEEFKERRAGKKYIILSKVRLFDIIKNWPECESWDKLKTSGKKTALIKELEENCSTIDDDKYKRLIVYPVKCLHVDFLICKVDYENAIPALVIELDGGYKEGSDYSGKNNDDLKSLIFNNISKNGKGETTFYRPEFKRIKNSEMDEPEFYNQLMDYLVNALESIEKYYRS